MGSRMRRAESSVVHRFAIACRAGSAGALRSLLTDDALALFDGGGKVPAELGPVRGADAVARCVAERLSLESGMALTVEAVNGAAGVVLRSAEAVVAVASLKVTAGKVSAVWMVLNPDKLRHWV
ncbi:hypothetical protein AB0E69_08840 [Kribbella sp. NPDC026611]|uniref:hypothetical protein n=1 Tax=Kribbella sp. NPDC026611 TaxID=3154911 RepID=UPI0033C5C7A1